MIEGPGTRREEPPPWDWIAVGFLLPVVGVVLAIVLLARNRGAHGAAVLTSSVLGFLAWSLVLGP